jgi:hypothetical protein
MSSRGKTTLQVLNIAGFALTLVVNALAEVLPINGRTTGELSDLYPNLFVPAGLTFSIWAVIYLLLALFSVFQALDLFARNKRPAPYLERIGGWFLVSSAANAGWILAWHYQQIALSLAIMLLLLACLLVVYLRLGIGSISPSRGVKVCVHLPFSVYLGWITIATVANVTALLVSVGWRRFGLSGELWTVVVLATAAAITIAMLLRRKDVFYGLVVLWAFAGIALKRLAVDPQPRTAVLLALAVGAAPIAVLVVLRFRTWLRT